MHGTGGGERLVDRAALGRLSALPDAAGEVALGVDIDKKDAAAGKRQRRGQVDGGRGFADAALLIGDGDDAGHSGV